MIIIIIIKEAINTLATPVVTYSFNIVDWKMEEN